MWVCIVFGVSWNLAPLHYVWRRLSENCQTQVQRRTTELSTHTDRTECVVMLSSATDEIEIVVVYRPFYLDRLCMVNRGF